MITKDDIKKVAHLARIQIGDDEVHHYFTELSTILEYVETLNELGFLNVEPTSHAVHAENVFRSDDEPCLNPVIEKVIKAAPEVDDQFFLVPKVL